MFGLREGLFITWAYRPGWFLPHTSAPSKAPSCTPVWPITLTPSVSSWPVVYGVLFVTRVEFHQQQQVSSVLSLTVRETSTAEFALCTLPFALP